MFTGIIEEIGEIKNIRSSDSAVSLSINCSKVLGRSTAGRTFSSFSGSAAPEILTSIGDSIAVNGVCLTVTRITGNSFEADVMPETMHRTAFSILKPGSPVNLERAMPVWGRFGGHIISGHIDGTGVIKSIMRDGNAVWYEIGVPKEIGRLIVEKGSIAIDGISLTVAEIHETDTFKVSIIPHTLSETSLSVRRTGDPVNLETDIIGKYIDRFLQNEDSSVPGRQNPAEKDRTALEEKYRKLFL